MVRIFCVICVFWLTSLMPSPSCCSLYSLRFEASSNQAPRPTWLSYFSTCPIRASWMAQRSHTRLSMVPSGPFFSGPLSDSCENGETASLQLRAEFEVRLYGSASHQAWRYFASVTGDGRLSQVWVRVPSITTYLRGLLTLTSQVCLIMCVLSFPDLHPRCNGL